MLKGLSRQDRKAYLSIAKRLTKRGSGTRQGVLRERTQHYGVPNLVKYLADVPFVVVGGLATRLYMPERMTLDIDVLISRSRLPDAEKALRKAACRKLGPLTVGGSSWRLPDGASLDVLALSDPWVDFTLANPVHGEDGLPYVDLPSLVLMKLASGRVQDLADITRMLGGANKKDLRRTQEHVRKWRPQDTEDLDSMIRLGKLEYQDMR